MCIRDRGNRCRRTNQPLFDKRTPVYPDNNRLLFKVGRSIRRRSLHFYYDPTLKTLYRRSYDGVLFRCLSHSEAREALKEAHDGICGAHQPGPKLKGRLHRLGYYWPTMIADAIQYARRCKACQIHADFIHQPLELLHPTITSWPFKHGESMS